MSDFKFFKVGGCVRDDILGIPSSDIDFSVVGPGGFPDVHTAFVAMKNHLTEQGFDIKKETETDCEPHQYLTVRAKVPNNHSLRQFTDYADFVMARKDGPYSDGRRPDWVVPGTLTDDLGRRDFTMNAIAVAENSDVIDPFDGVTDIQNCLIRFVGEPMVRINEDGLRVARAFRFCITKNFEFERDTWKALKSVEAANMLHRVHINRVRDELHKMFIHDSEDSLRFLCNLPEHTFDAIFRDGLRLDVTLKEKK
jgi:tRNA nucleotidyltransferase (CCA-adding enzyme)